MTDRFRAKQTKRKIMMQHFEPLPITAHIRLIAHVYYLGGVDVRYAPEEGDAPMQRAALFKNRSGLAKKFERLGLREEADIITHSDAQFHFTFIVANKPEIMDSFEFSKPVRLLG
jgi:hypothetical protein